MERMGISEGAGLTGEGGQQGSRRERREQLATHTHQQTTASWGPEDRGRHDGAGWLGWETKDVPTKASALDEEAVGTVTSSLGMGVGG